eukprot:CAMPEP_0174270816 /NCGR_PEP_ID=MMETSP0439-20130205/45819_1 /TAXON_ID=0 /ORGANISM="Stereomyxa ramosa, Strain Chinc5" /LENGTH=132 /DNA_ID=CAMNT_0015360387 /DNA_START=104 /DNA_END=498 /DNA_ORIENTATION=-
MDEQFSGETCMYCGNTGKLKKCGGCQIVSYCSKSCQRSHWKAHKFSCTKETCLTKIEARSTGTADNKGLGLFAKTNIVAGETVIADITSGVYFRRKGCELRLCDFCLGKIVKVFPCPNCEATFCSESHYHKA